MVKNLLTATGLTIKREKLDELTGYIGDQLHIVLRLMRAFIIPVAITMSVSIAASTAIFYLVDGILLPLTFTILINLFWVSLAPFTGQIGSLVQFRKDISRLIDLVFDITVDLLHQTSIQSRESLPKLHDYLFIAGLGYLVPATVTALRKRYFIIGFFISIVVEKVLTYCILSLTRTSETLPGNETGKPESLTLTASKKADELLQAMSERVTALRVKVPAIVKTSFLPAMTLPVVGTIVISIIYCALLSTWLIFLLQ
jgi:hypothetical protein